MAGGPTTLWQAFDDAAATAPQRAALILPEGTVTFSELCRLALRCAAWLAAWKIGKGDIVALQLPKRLEAYAMWLACLHRGAPYVFVDPRNPTSRTEAIVAQLSPKLLVTAGEGAAASDRVQVLPSVADGRAWLDQLPDRAPPPPAPCHGLDPAYVMFTSGSTGEPKGAVIPQQGVLSLMRWVRQSIGDPASDRFAGLNPLHFDNSVFDLYGGLINGATLVPVETAAMANPAHWVRALRDGGATILFAVPTLFQTLQRVRLLTPEALPAACVFVFGGEGFPIADLAEFHARFRGRARLVNVYGPTETSCICSSHPIDDEALAAAGTGFASLGRMHPDFAHAILDENGRDVAKGETGELWIGGANVGLGYYAKPDETAQRFRQDPRQSAYRSIWYRSGDLVREDGQGLLWFCGRADNQVKIRGHRIELEEIDLAIESVDGVTRAVAVVGAGRDGPELHVAFMAANAPAETELRARCRERLPPYMQPTVIRHFDDLPKNANGKVDRKAVSRLLASRGDDA